MAARRLTSFLLVELNPSANIPAVHQYAHQTRVCRGVCSASVALASSGAPPSFYRRPQSGAGLVDVSLVREPWFRQDFDDSRAVPSVSSCHGQPKHLGVHGWASGALRSRVLARG